MSKFIEATIVAVVAFLTAVFLPKNLVAFVRELTKFIFTSIFKNWYFTVIITGLFFYFNFKTDYTYFGQFTSYKFILTVIIIVSTVVTIVALLKEIYKNYKPINIALYGCFSVKENEYLTIDIDSENLNEKIKIVTEKVTDNLFSYRNNLIKTNNIIIPKFIPIVLGHNGLNKFIKRRVDAKKHLATLHFIKDINKQNVSVIINYDKDNLTNTNPIVNAEQLINNLSSDNDLNCSKTIELSVKIYLLLFGQSLTDLMLNGKDLSNIHYILDDTEKLITEIRNDTSNFSETHKKEVEHFLNFWTSYIQRYKAILLIEQKQFVGAVQHIVKSIKFNPYFPYDSYVSLKHDFTKKYGIALASTLNETNKILETNIDDKATDKVKAELMKQVQFAETSFNYEIIKGILQNDNSKEIGDLLISEIDKLDKSNPFILLTKNEVIKYIKKGTEKFNEIYVDRFDECINILRETIKFDSEFPLLNTKLGMMIMMKGMHYKNEQLIEEGAIIYKKGIHFMVELGFKQ
ncbi:MAG: hypothetical protein ACOYLE_07060 [Bacteroidales bacterium]